MKESIKQRKDREVADKYIFNQNIVLVPYKGLLEEYSDKDYRVWVSVKVNGVTLTHYARDVKADSLAEAADTACVEVSQMLGEGG